MNVRFDRAHGPELDAGAARFHQQAVEAPSRSEGQFFSLAEALPAMVWAARPDGWTEYVNRRWTDYTGLTLEQCRGSGWTDALHPADRQRCLELWGHASQAGEAFEMEYRFRDRNGGHRWFLGRASPVRDAAGQVTRWLGSALDIDDRKRARSSGNGSSPSSRTRPLHRLHHARRPARSYQWGRAGTRRAPQRRGGSG